MQKNSDTPKKQYYMVELETIATVILKYRVLSDSPENAIEEVNKGLGVLIQTPKPKLPYIKKIKAKVYNFGTNLLRATKNF